MPKKNLWILAVDRIIRSNALNLGVWPKNLIKWKCQVNFGQTTPCHIIYLTHFHCWVSICLTSNFNYQFFSRYESQQKSYFNRKISLLLFWSESELFLVNFNLFIFVCFLDIRKSICLSYKTVQLFSGIRDGSTWLLICYINPT